MKLVQITTTLFSMEKRHLYHDKTTAWGRIKQKTVKPEGSKKY